MMSARSYRTKIGLSVIDKLRKRIRELLALYSEAIDKYFQPTRQNSIYCNDNQYLEKDNAQLREEKRSSEIKTRSIPCSERCMAKDRLKAGCVRQKKYSRSKKNDQERTGGSDDLPLPLFHA